MLTYAKIVQDPINIDMGASSANPSKTISIDSIYVYLDFLDAFFCKNMWETTNIDLGGCIANCKNKQI